MQIDSSAKPRSTGWRFKCMENGIAKYRADDIELGVYAQEEAGILKIRLETRNLANGTHSVFFNVDLKTGIIVENGMRTGFLKRCASGIPGSNAIKSWLRDLDQMTKVPAPEDAKKIARRVRDSLIFALRER